MGHGALIVRSLGSSWLLLGVVAMTQLAQIPIALHQFGKEEFGMFALLSQLFGNLLLVEMGVSVAVSRLMIDARIAGPERYQRLWSSALGIFAMQAGVVLTASLACIPMIPRMFNLPQPYHNEARLVFFALAVNGVVGFLTRPWVIVMFAAQRVTASNFVQTGAALIQFGVFAVSAFSGLRIWSLVIGAFALTVFSTVGFFYLAKRVGLAPRFSMAMIDWNEIRGVFRFALELFSFGFFNVFIQNSFLILAAWHQLPIAVIAALSVNAKLLQLSIQVLQRIPASAESFLMNLLGHGDHKRFRFGWMLAAKTSLVAAAWLAGCVHLFTAHFVGWWAGSSMVLPSGVVLWLAVLPIRHMIHQSLVTSLVMLKEIRVVRWALVRELAAYVLLAWLLTPRFGISGLVASNVLSILVGAPWSGAPRFSQLAGIPLPHFLISLTQALLPGLAALALLAALLPQPGQGSLGQLLGFGFGWSLLHAGLFWRFALSPQERHHLSGLFRRILLKFRPK